MDDGKVAIWPVWQLQWRDRDVVGMLSGHRSGFPFLLDRMTMSMETSMKASDSNHRHLLPCRLWTVITLVTIIITPAATNTTTIRPRRRRLRPSSITANHHTLSRHNSLTSVITSVNRLTSTRCVRMVESRCLRYRTTGLIAHRARLQLLLLCQSLYLPLVRLTGETLRHQRRPRDLMG